MIYRPLNKSLTIKNSEIEGLGLFAQEDIKKGTMLGITHVPHDNFPNGYIRTPLGGFYNHSTEPNCLNTPVPGGYLALLTLRDIKEGEELSATYSLYDPS